MNKDITIYERDVIVGAMHNILKVEQDPYPFQDLHKFFEKPQWDPSKTLSDQKLSFYQLLEVPDELRYSDMPVTITNVDQR